MTIHTSKYQSFCWLLLWLGVSALSYYLVYLKYLALDFHTRDYAFYTEFIIKWSKPASEQYYSMNPGGYNFLGISAVDGCDGFYQWVHFEPIRFIQAFIYKITHSLQAVFIFNSLLVCSPVLIIGSWLKNINTSFWGKLIWMILFVSFPATLLAAGYDNRPAMFLGVGYFWILYTHLATKNKGLQIASFLLLFLIREEALILNGIVCFYMFLQWRKKEEPGLWLFIYSSALVAYGLGLYGYFHFWNYQFFAATTNTYPTVVLIGFTATIILWLLYALLKKKPSLILFIPLFLFAAQLVSMKMNSTFPDEKFQYFNDPRWLMLFLVTLGFALYTRMNNKKLLMIACFMTIPVFILLTFFGTHSIHGKIGAWRWKQQFSVALFEFSKTIGYKDRLLVDYSTHQCFLGYPNLLCVDRLPCSMDGSSGRFYPDNFEKLKTLVGPNTYFVYKDAPFSIHQLLGDKDIFQLMMLDNGDYNIIKFMNPYEIPL